MKGNCIQFNVKHTILRKEPINSLAGTPKLSNRKRTMMSISVRNPDELSAGINPDATLVKSRKKITASRRLKKQMSPVVLIDLNEIKNRDDIISAVFSPQFNISQNILSGDAKSSTPLYDEKENPPVIAIFDKIDMSMYETPSTIQSSSLVVVSALKKSTPREGIIKDGNSKSVKKSDSRRVTFEMARSPEIDENLEVSVYATPEMELRSDYARSRRSGDQRELTISFERVENDENSKVEISIYGTLESDVEPMVHSSDAEADKRGRDCAAVVELVRNMKSAVTGIPRMIFNACGWSMRIIRKRKSDETSPVGSAKRKHRSLRRRPISSHWVNLSASSLRRRPLSAYQDIEDNNSFVR
jgi:hypothetical protein